VRLPAGIQRARASRASALAGRLRVGLASRLMLLSTSGEGAAGTYPAFEPRSISPRDAKRWRGVERRSAPGARAGPLPISSRSDRARFVVSIYSTR
jgi:hypothetical protein